MTLSLGFGGTALAPAFADEAPTTAAEALKIVEKLQAEQAELDKQYNQINARATEIGDRVDAQRQQVATADKRIAQIKSQLGAVALASYQGRGQDSTMGLLTSADANSFLTRIGTVDQVTANQTVSLQTFQTEQANLKDLQRALAVDEAAAQAERKRLDEVDQAARAKVVEAQKVADRLSAEEKAKLEAEQAAKAKAEAEARAAAEAEGRRTAATQSTAQQRMAAAQTTAAATAAQPAAQPAPTQAARTVTQAAQPAAAATTQAPAAQPTQAAQPTYSSPQISAGANLYSWGQCTWWAYNRRLQLGRPVGNNWGNANAWPSSAAAAGFAVNGTPQVGDVLIQFYAPVGHAAVVEAVNGNSVYISEMNWNGGIGVLHYRTVTLPAGVFIH